MMTETESLRIIREVFDGVVIDNIVVEYEAIVDERVAKVYVPVGEIEAALADNGALPRRAAIQSGLAVEVVLSEN